MTAILPSQEYTVDCSVAYNVVYPVGGAVHELAEKSFIANSGGTFLFSIGNSCVYRVVNLWSSNTGGSDVSDLLFCCPISLAVRAMTSFPCRMWGIRFQIFKGCGDLSTPQV